MEEFSSKKNLILRNIFWGKLNTLLRYSLAFVATSFLARNFSPEIFGSYQLILSYLVIFEAFLFANPTHLRNYLASNPNEERTVISLWIWQNILIFFAILIICGVSSVLSDEKIFWLLLSVTTVRLLLRYNDYVWIICDQRLLNHLAQQVAIVQNISLNVFRIIFAALKTDLFWLCFSSPLQGVCSICQQKMIAKKVGIVPSYAVDIKKFFNIVSDGFFLSVLSFISIFQSRIVSLVLAENLSPQHFGNFQLVIKLMEPATMLGVTILGANYSVLAKTFQDDLKLFHRRFFKISLLITAMSILMTGFINMMPLSWLVRFFGQEYTEGLSLIGLGSLIVVSNTLFWIDQHYDFLKKDYMFSLLKYLVMLLGYLLAGYFLKDNISIVSGLWISIIVPLGISVGSILYRFFTIIRS